MSIEDTLEARGGVYGDFTDHAAIAQKLQDVMHDTVGWDYLTAVQRQALTVIADKQARILSGNPNYKDNWHDIQGYAKLAEDRCEDTDPRQMQLFPETEGSLQEAYEAAIMPEVANSVTYRLTAEGVPAVRGSKSASGTGEQECQHGVKRGLYCAVCLDA